MRTILGGAALILASLAMIFSIRIFLWQPFNIPSGAQMPTLVPGDEIFASKYAYGYSRHSFPFSAGLFSGRIFAKEPERGDVVIFKLPRDNRTDYVKRVIGLPGETIVLRDGIVHIDGKAVAQRRVEDFAMPEDGRSAAQYEETLPNGVSYRVLDLQVNGPLDNGGPYKVPAGHYFVLGDNRDNSSDSRSAAAVGYVPFVNLVGRAEIIYRSSAPDGASRAGRLLGRGSCSDFPTAFLCGVADAFGGGG